MLARDLRDAAVNAERPDVAAKAEEAIALLTGPDGAAGGPGDAAAGREGGGSANTVVRILDGLGF